MINFILMCRLYEVKDERHAEAFLRNVSLAEEDALPLAERVSALENKQKSGLSDGVKCGPGGSREITFISRRPSKNRRTDKEEEPRSEKRRGIQSLGLKVDIPDFGGRGRGGRRGGRGGGRRGGGRGGRRGGRGRH